MVTYQARKGYRSWKALNRAQFYPIGNERLMKGFMRESKTGLVVEFE